MGLGETRGVVGSLGSWFAAKMFGQLHVVPPGAVGADDNSSKVCNLGKTHLHVCQLRETGLGVYHQFG